MQTYLVRWTALLLCLAAPGHARDYLSGQAIDHTALARHGFSIEPSYTSEAWCNVHGGLHVHDAPRYRGMLELDLGVDTGQAGAWSGGQWGLQVLSLHGQSSTGHDLGDIQGLSNIDWRNFTRPAEGWYRQEFDHGHEWVRVGYFDGSELVGAPSNGGLFINSSPGLVPTMPIPTYPTNGWAAFVGLQPPGHASLRLGAMWGQGSALGSKRAPFVVAEPAVAYELAGQAGTLKVGCWWHGGRFATAGGGSAVGSQGLYVTVDQALSDKLAFFAQAGWAPRSRSVVYQYQGIGVQRTAPFGRPGDVVGLGVFRAAAGPLVGAAPSSEVACELFYRAKLDGWLTLQPDVQYIRHPGAVLGSHDALVVGVRSVVRF